MSLLTQTSQLDRIAIAYGQSDPNGAFPATKKMPDLPPSKLPPTQEHKDAVKEAKEAKRQLEAAEMELAALRAEMDEMTKGYEGRVGLLEGKSLAERQRLGDALAEAEAAAAWQAEQEKQERIELLRRQIARRIMNQGYIRGWTAWHEMWSAKNYALGRLRQCASRMQKPQRTRKRPCPHKVVHSVEEEETSRP